MTPIPWEVWGGWGMALAALITAAVGGVKVAAEVRHEMRPNSGGSMRDAIDRIELLVADLASDVEQLARTGRRHDAELARANDALVQLQGITADAVTRVHRRLDDHSVRLHEVEVATHPNHHLGAPHD